MAEGLKLTSDVGVGVDWLRLGKAFVEAVSGGIKAATGDALSGGKAALALLDGIKSFELKIAPGNRAVELVILSFAAAIDNIRANDVSDFSELNNVARSAIEKLKNEIQYGNVFIPFDFYENPARAAPYIILRDVFISDRGKFRVSAEEPLDQLRFKLDVAFRKAIWEVWSSRPSAFADLDAALRHPSAKLPEFDRQWKAYRESLVADFNVRPVFGQEDSKVSVGQLYVPLRCLWTERDAGAESDHGHSRPPLPLLVGDLETELANWIDNQIADDWLRLLGGGPGSGKSTSARAVAAKLAVRDDLRPLFIPLQRLGDGRLRDSINSYFSSRSGSPFLAGPLERKHVEAGPRLLLIFDGLDEVARPGESADEIAREFVDWITDLHAELTGETGLLHRVLVTGRMPSFQAARKRSGRKGRHALEVAGLLPIFPSLPVVRTEQNASLLELDQRMIWWEKYAVALRRPETLPDSMRDRRLESLTGEPLLCYLLALSGYLESDSNIAAENRNKIYERLLEDVWKRSWGGGRAGKGKDLSKEDFDLLFESMALAAWHGGDERVATYERFTQALKIVRAEDAYRNFEKNEGDDVSNLAVNFYLKQPESESRGFEFTHKSFGEYLASRALLRAAFLTAELTSARLEFAMLEWQEAVLDGQLTFELLEFLRDEARLRPLAEQRQMRSGLLRMLSQALTAGFPAHQLQCKSWRDAEERQRRAEVMLLAALNSVTLSLAASGDTDLYVRLPSDSHIFGKLIHRIRRVRAQNIPEMRLFAWFDISGQYLLSQELIGIDLHNGIARDVTFELSTIRNGDFRRVDFSNSRLTHVAGQGSNFYMAKFEQTNFEGSDLSDSSFACAHIDAVGVSRLAVKDIFTKDVVFAKKNRQERKKFQGSDDKNKMVVDMTSVRPGSPYYRLAQDAKVDVPNRVMRKSFRATAAKTEMNHR